MLCKKIIVIYSKIHVTNINAVCVDKAGVFNFKLNLINYSDTGSQTTAVIIIIIITVIIYFTVEWVAHMIYVLWSRTQVGIG
jgi:hypothetical protein